ncbi:hypothetical protein ZIOFF_030753 [Zingiber officinale]|uniref:Uncharacterized protein n=1 Tax=Zingiber officinale TaxID=94328 RepID=A0A8J5GRE8_ZINOF|nr:hypothetical protein ZIOFF_030753 [Zingiber officinale]
MVEDNYRNSAIEIMKNFQFAYEQTKKLEQKLKNFEKELKLKNIELEKKNKELQKLKEMLKGKTKENEDAENIGERSPLPPRRRFVVELQLCCYLTISLAGKLPEELEISPPRHGRSPSRRSPPLHRHRSRSPMRGRSPSPRRGLIKEEATATTGATAPLCVEASNHIAGTVLCYISIWLIIVEPRP